MSYQVINREGYTPVYIGKVYMNNNHERNKRRVLIVEANSKQQAEYKLTCLKITLATLSKQAYLSEMKRYTDMLAYLKTQYKYITL